MADNMVALLETIKTHPAYWRVVRCQTVLTEDHTVKVTLTMANDATMADLSLVLCAINATDKVIWCYAGTLGNPFKIGVFCEYRLP